MKRTVPFDTIQRGLDLTLAIGLIFFLSPVLILTALIVRIKMGSPVVFTHERAGRNEQPFVLYKFRTMAVADESDPNAPTPEQRITKLGHWLRTLSLDELPQLWNVLKGDVSLVGPRPLPLVYLPRYSAEQRRRHDVRPGITGWAQINGRNSISWEQKFKLDIWWVDHRSISFYMKILFLTGARVIFRHGIKFADNLNMPEFKGSPQTEI